MNVSDDYASILLGLWPTLVEDYTFNNSLRPTYESHFKLIRFGPNLRNSALMGGSKSRKRIGLPNRLLSKSATKGHAPNRPRSKPRSKPRSRPNRPSKPRSKRSPIKPATSGSKPRSKPRRIIQLKK